jgi:phage head maturation protease
MEDMIKSELNFFLPIAKFDKQSGIVSGYASTETVDSDGEIISLDAVKAALPDYMKYGNIREMHKPSAVGVAKEANFDKKGLWLSAKITDKEALQKIEDGVYKGFSIGGYKTEKVGNKVTKLEMHEISVVDRPANPDCSMKLAKGMKAAEEVHAPGYLLKIKRTPEEKKIRLLAKLDTISSASNLIPHVSLPEVKDKVDQKDLKPKTKKKKLKKENIPNLGKTVKVHSPSLNQDFLNFKLLAKANKKGAVMTKQYDPALVTAIMEALQKSEKPSVATCVKSANESLSEVKKAKKDIVDNFKSVHKMHKAAYLGKISKAAKGKEAEPDNFDHEKAMEKLQAAYSGVQKMGGFIKSARTHIEKAIGMISDTEGGKFPLGAEVKNISSAEMDTLGYQTGEKNAKPGPNVLGTEGPTQKMAKAIMAATSPETLELALSNARLEGENEALRRLPVANSNRPYAFNLAKLAGSSPTQGAKEALLKGVNPDDLSSGDFNRQEAASLQLLTNYLANPVYAKSVNNPDFHGGIV